MNDEYHGHGGSYLADPKTGKRKLIERTGELLVQAEPAPSVVAEPIAPAVEDTDEVE